MKLNSSNLLEGEYDEENRRLRITFKGGAQYDYFDVPPEVAAEFFEAESHGKFLATQIKGVYRYQKVP